MKERTCPLVVHQLHVEAEAVLHDWRYSGRDITAGTLGMKDDANTNRARNARVVRGRFGLLGFEGRGVVLLDACEIQSGWIIHTLEIIRTQPVRSCARDEVFSIVLGKVEMHLVL